MSHTPFTVLAHLASPPVLAHPLMLDALLLAGLGAEMGAAHPSGWAEEAQVLEAVLPLAQVRHPSGLWWYAASQITPHGKEQRDHLNRVPPIRVGARWTSARSLNVASGPDKRMRKPFFYRPGMLRLEWTGVGDRGRVASLLSRVPGVGSQVAHGHGWVRRWEISEGGPDLEAYRDDVAMRHLPEQVSVDMMGGGHISRRAVPLRPPYWLRRKAVSCWQQVRA